MREFYTAIAEVYQEVGRATPHYQGNPCGECRSCCTSAIKTHNVSELELATMAFHLGEERVDLFRRFLARERDKHGVLVYPECPNLDARGCTVHEFRPLSCRLYGHFRSQAVDFFEHCVFRGKETVFSDEKEHLLTPGQVRLTELNIEYLSYFSATSGGAVTGPMRDPQTDLERASHLQANGDYESAIEILIGLRQTEDSPNIMLMLAECYGHLKDYAAAVAILDEAIARSPRNPELYSRKGSNCLFAGRLPEARQALELSVELAPDRRNALGLLGLVHRLNGDLEKAELCLVKAVSLEDEPGPFRLQLGLVLKSLGRFEASREALIGAQQYEPTAAQAMEAQAQLESET